MTEQPASATREPLQIVPDAEAVERITDADRMLLLRAEARIGLLRSGISTFQAELQWLEGLISSHMSFGYKLQPNDQVEDDGTIKRLRASREEPPCAL